MVLKNKLGITSQVELNREEERLSKQALVYLWEQNSLLDFKSGSIKGLKFIHKKTFEDVYYFAGEFRNVNIGKGNFMFCNVQYIETALAEVENMNQSNLKEIVEKYSELNVVHPFREGNGRTSRFWLDDILKTELGQVVNWNNIDKVDYFNAMIQSPTNTAELYNLIKYNLTFDTNDREIFFKGLDSSYWYEDMNEYRTKDLVKEEELDKINSNIDKNYEKGLKKQEKSKDNEIER